MPKPGRAARCRRQVQVQEQGTMRANMPRQLRAASLERGRHGGRRKAYGFGPSPPRTRRHPACCHQPLSPTQLSQSTLLRSYYVTLVRSHSSGAIPHGPHYRYYMYKTLGAWPSGPTPKATSSTITKGLPRRKPGSPPYQQLLHTLPAPQDATPRVISLKSLVNTTCRPLPSSYDTKRRSPALAANEEAAASPILLPRARGCSPLSSSLLRSFGFVEMVRLP